MTICISRRTAAFASVGVAAAACGVLTAGLLAGPGTGVVQAGGHVDSPRLILDSQMDGSDLYAHTCPDAPEMVCLIADYTPAQQGDGKPFADDARYDINVDQQGDGVPDIVYRWTFGRGRGDAPQPYVLDEVRPGQRTVTLAKGTAVHAKKGLGEARAKAIATLPGGGRAIATKAADPFFSNSNVVGLALTGTTLVPPIDLIEALNGNVNVLVLQLPKSRLALKNDPVRNPVIGVWTTSARRSMGITQFEDERYPQMSRMGTPAVDVLTFFSMGEQFNALRPVDDRHSKSLTGFIREPGAPKLIATQHLGFTVPPTPRDDLWQVYMTGIAKGNGPIARDLNAHSLNADADPKKAIPCEELRLNMNVPQTSSPSRFGLLDNDAQGFPNGRRLNDDVHTMLIRMLMGEPAAKGAPDLVAGQVDKVTGPQKPVSRTFPYVPLPH